MTDPDDPDEKEPPSFEDFLSDAVKRFDKDLYNASRELRKHPEGDLPDVVFRQFKEVTGMIGANYPRILDGVLQSMQYYCQDMIDTLKKTYQESEYRTAAGMYAEWMELYRGYHHYDPAKIADMMDANMPWILARANEYVPAAVAAVETTLIMQERLLDRHVIAPKKVSQFVFHDAAPFIRDLPNITESGLQDDMMDPAFTESHGVLTSVHTYSYARKAEMMYDWSLQLMRRTAPKKGVPALIEKMQPALSASLARKHEEITTTNGETGELSVYLAGDTKSALNAMRNSIKMLKETGTPEQMYDFIKETYHDVARIYVEYDEVGCLKQLYDMALDGLQVDTHRHDFADYFAARHVQDLMAQESGTQAGIFLEHLRKKSGIDTHQVLVLTDPAKDKVIAASVPLMVNDKVRDGASLLFMQGADDIVTHIVMNERRAPLISFSAKTRDLEIKDDFTNQAVDLSKKLLAGGLIAPFNVLSDTLETPRWRVINYKNI